MPRLPSTLDGNKPHEGFTILIASMVGAIAVLELAGRVAAARWPVASFDDLTDDDESSVIALDLSAVSAGW